MDYNDKIFNEIKDYILGKNSDYAILIDGQWGSGKTYFVKNSLIPFIEEINENTAVNKKRKKRNSAKKPIYISLYGISSISDLMNQIYVNLITKGKYNKTFSIFRFMIGVSSDLVSSHTSIKDTESKLGKLLGDLINVEDSIIIFDDLERCSMSINVILGYINNLVEHNNIKVLILSNEKEIGKADFDKNIELKFIAALNERIDYPSFEEERERLNKVEKSNDKVNLKELKQNAEKIFNQNLLYDQIKEKLIGRTIYYKPNMNTIFSNLTEKIIETEEIKNFILAEEEMVISIMKKYDYWNLRTLKFALKTFEKMVIISTEVTDLKEFKNQYLSDLLNYCLQRSIYIKKGIIEYNWDKDKEYGTVSLIEEDSLHTYNYINGFKFVDDYIIQSEIDKLRIKNVIENYIFEETAENRNPDDPLYKLNSWWYMSESEVENLLGEMYNNASENKYILNLYSKIVFQLSILIKANILTEMCNKIIIKLKENVSKLDQVGNFADVDMFMISKDVSEIYEKNVKEIRIIAHSKKGDTIEHEFLEAEKSEEWGSALKKIYLEHEGEVLKTKKFIGHLNVKKIVENIFEKNNYQLFEFIKTLNSIYRASNVSEFYQSDLSYLKEMIDLLKSTNLSKIDNIKGYGIKGLIESLESIIDRLESK